MSSLLLQKYCYKTILENKKQKENNDGKEMFLGTSDVDINNEIIEGPQQSSQLYTRMQVIVHCKLNTIIILFNLKVN